MKQIPITTIAAVLLVGCGEAQQSAPAPETKPVEPVAEVPARPSAPPVEAKPVEPVAEAAQLEPPTAKAPDISIHDAAKAGDIETVKQHLAAGTEMDVKGKDGWTSLHWAASSDHEEIAELLIAKGADVNAKDDGGETPLDFAIRRNHTETADLLRKHGGKTGEELKAEGK